MAKKLLTLFCAFAATLSVIFSGCTVGLGEAVDTQPPEVDISYPENTKVIRDWFILSGTCSDETSIDYVSITVKNSTTKKVWGPEGQGSVYKATLSEDRESWTCKINEKDADGNYIIPDGVYEITATAVDKATRKTSVQKTYTIDNTEPVILLTNPSTIVGSKDGTCIYGVSLSIEGTAADANEIPTLTFTAYDNDGKLLKSATASNVSQGLGITLSSFLKKSDGYTDEEIAASFYNQLYGELSEEAETKYFKYKISLEDNAKIYQDVSVTEGTGSGNKSAGYYIYNDVYKALSGKSARDIYNYMSGADTDTKGVLEAIKPYLHESDEEDTEQAPVGTFGLNPMNNPTYEVQTFEAFDPVDTNWNNYTISSTGKINILATPGRSNTPLDSDTFSVVIYDSDETGKKTGEEVVVPFTLGSPAGSSYPITVTLNNSIVSVTKYYGIELKGQDQDGLSFSNGSTIYRFFVKNSSTPPTVNVLTVDGNSVPNSGVVYHKAGTDVTITGTATSKSGSTSAHVTITPAINTKDAKLTAYQVTTVSNTENSWSVTIPASEFTAEDSNYSIILIAEDDIHETNESTNISLYYDKTAPVTDFVSVSLVTVYEEATEISDGTTSYTVIPGRAYVNNVITVKGNITDDAQFASGSWKAVAKKDGAETLIASGTISSANFTFEVDTRTDAEGNAVANESELYISVTAEDKAGNSSTTTYLYDDNDDASTNLVPLIHQFTDYPVFTPTNFNQNIKVQSDITEENNLFKTTDKLTGTVSDDDGISSLVLYFTTDLSAGITDEELASRWTKVDSYRPANKTTYSLSQSLKNLPQTCYQFYAVTTDKNGLKSVCGPYLAAISNSAPVIEIKSPSQNSWASDTISVAGTITATSPVLKIEASTDSVDSSLDISAAVTISGTDFTHTIRTGTDGATVDYKITDLYGRYSETSLSFKLDKVKPTMAPDFTVPSAAWQNSSACTITVPVSDVYNKTASDAASETAGEEKVITYASSSGISTVTGIIDNDADSKFSLSNTGKKYSSIYTAKKYAEVYDLYSATQSLDDGQHKIKVTAADGSDNTTDALEFTFKVDTVAPVITSVTPDSNHPDGVNNSNKDKPFYWDVVTADKNGELSVSGVSSIEIYNGSVAADNKISEGITITDSEGNAVSAPYADGTYRVNFASSILTTGAHTFVVLVKDAAGNSSQKSGTVNIDVTAPELTINGFSPYVSKTVDSKEVHYANGTITVSFVAKDETALGTTGSVEWAVKSSDLKTTYKTGTVDLKGSTYENGTFTIDTAETSGTGDSATRVIPDGTYKLVITLKDKVGNTAVNSDTELRIDQTTDKPTVTLSNANINLTSASDVSSADLHNLFGNGSNVIYGTAEDDDGISAITYSIDAGTSDAISGSVTVSGNPTTKTFQIDLSTVKSGSTIDSGAHTITYTVTDKNGLSATYPESGSMAFAFDNDIPKISVTTVNGSAYSYNMWAPGSFDVVGTATDGSGVAKVYLKTDSSKKSLITKGANTASAEWKHSISGQTADGSVSYVVEDIYGRSFETAISYQVDIVSPEFNKYSAVDSSEIRKGYNKLMISGGSKTFTENEYNSSSASPTSEESNTYYIGLKDSKDKQINWFNSSLITITGSVTDTNFSTVELYKGDAASTTVSALQYSANFSFTEYFDIGLQSFSIKAIDKAGNSTVIGPFSIYIDENAPAISVESLKDSSAADVTSASVYKSSEKLKLKVKVNDSAINSSPAESVSGVRIISIGTSFGFQTPIITPDTYDYGTAANSEVSKEIEIPLTSLSDGDYSLYARVSDAAGNSCSDYSAGSFKVDSKAPYIEITSPSTGSSVCKYIKITGTVDDDNLEENGSKPVLKYYDSNETKWKNAETVNTSRTNSNWTIVFNTAKLNSTSTASDVYFYVEITDAAGNKTAAPETTADSNVLKLSIDQNKGRPKVVVTNLSSSQKDSNNYLWLKNTDTLYTSFSAGDSNDLITSIQYQFNGVSGSWASLDTSASSLTLPTEGSQKLYFKITTKSSISETTTDYVSGSSSSLNAPVLYAAASALSDTFYSINMDKTSPSVQNLKVASYNSETSEYTDFNTNYLSTSNFGGKYTKISIQIEARDSNGIKSVSLKDGSYVPESCVSKKAGTIKDSNNDEWEIWQVTDFPINAYSGSKTLTYVVEDGSGSTTSNSIQINVDNNPPEIGFITPSTTISSTEVIRGTLDSNCTVSYAITKSDVTDDTSITTWNSVSDASLSWSIYFDGITAEGQTHDKMLRNYLVDLGICTEAELNATTNPYDDITTLKLWLKAIDSVGNESVKSENLIIDPQGNRPAVTISYPEKGKTYGGTIRAMGTATVNSTQSIKYVWIQIDIDNDGDFDKDDVARLYNTLDYTFGKIATNSELSSSEMTSKLSDSSTDWSGYAIRVTPTGSSWSQVLNQDNELSYQATGSTETKNQIKMIVYATDDASTPNVSQPVELSITVDSDAPVIEQDSLKLVQYDDENNIVASQSYTDGMNVRGEWFLVGNITDGSGISAIKIDGTVVVGSETNTSTYATTSYIDSEKGITLTPVPVYKEDGVTVNYNNYSFKLKLGEPLSSTTVGTDSIHLIAYEVKASSAAYVDKTFSVNYDNMPPEVVELTADSGSSVRTVANSDGFFTFGSTATEVSVGGVSQTGVERVAFYFTRDYDATSSLFDVMIKSGETGNEISEYTDLTNSENLYWKTQKVTVSGSTLTVTEDVNIHTGGLAKVNGVIYRIESASGTTVLLSGEPGDTAEDETVDAYFAIANVIDNPIAENNGTTKNSAGYYTNSDSYEDGDLMIEKLINQGTSYTWQANINSCNVSDGPAVLHYVTFDKAGNYTSKTLNCFVKNNQPRIAGFKVGTDEDGDGTVSDSEYITTWSGLYTNLYTDVDGVTQKGYKADGTRVTEISFPAQDSKVNHPTSALTIKGQTSVKPEIIGGNGTITYSYDVYKYASSALITGSETDYSHSWASVAYASRSGSSDGIGTGTTDGTDDGLCSMDVTVKDLLSTTEITDGNYQKFHFVITDSTPQAAQTAVINLVMNVDVRDTTAPTNKIIPFYWNSVTENSVYKDSTTGKLLGHIELSKDLPSAFGTSNAQTSIKDKDPKVSGKIKVEGVAHDNTLLTGLSASVTGITGSITLGTFENGSWSAGTGTLASTGWISTVEKATYEQAVKTGVITAIPSGKLGTDLISYTSQEYGSVVHWTLVIDTEKLSNSAAKDVQINVTALDQGKPELSGTTVTYTSNTFVPVTSQSGGTDGTGTLSTRYYIDVVPYITQITRSNTTNSTTTMNRSTYGQYPVAIGDTLTVSGYNFGLSSTVNVGGTTLTSTANALTTAMNTITFTVPANSGEVTVTNNEVTNINSENNNSCQYNKANNDSTSTLYDDKYIRVWDLGHYFGGSTGGYSPTFAADNAGNLFSTWTLMGSSSVMLQRGLATNAYPVYVSFDQPDKETWLGIDKSTKNGSSSILLFPANVGSSGTPSSNGYSASENIGGAWAVGLKNDPFASVSTTNPSTSDDTRRDNYYIFYYDSTPYKYISIKNNPYTKTDSKIRCPGWELASYAMRREVSLFKNARTARYGGNMHFAYYDSQNKSVRYTYQYLDEKSVGTAGTEYTAGLDESSGLYNKFVGWNLIDGNTDGTDRVHDRTDSSKDIYNLSVSRLSGTTLTLNSSVTCSSGDSIGIAYTTAAGLYKFALRTIQNNVSSGKSITLSSGISDINGTPTGCAIYRGDSNVASNGITTNSNSVGSYLSIDVNPNDSGKPVIVYYDSANTTLRIAYSTSATPSMSSKSAGADTWYRYYVSTTAKSTTKDTAFAGGTYVQSKFDPSGNLHIVYRNNYGALCYIKGTGNSTDGYSFTSPQQIDSSGTYATISVYKSGTEYVPVVSWLNSEETESSVKFAVLRTVDNGVTSSSLWDTEIVPAVTKDGNHYATGSSLVYTEGNYAGTWDATNDSVSMGDCDAAVGFSSGRMDVVFLKSE